MGFHPSRRRFAAPQDEDKEQEEVTKKVLMVRSAAAPRVSNHGRKRILPMRIRIDQTTPAASVERRPLALRLRQAISDGIDDGGMMAHAAMAALDLDAL